MKYSIVTIDDSRKEYKDRIRDVMEGEEVFIPCLDARPKTVGLTRELSNHGLRFANHWKNLMWKRGDIGGYISHFRNWEYAAENGPLMVFEDDAIIPDGFYDNVQQLMQEVPDDFGVVSFCVNGYNEQFYLMDVKYNEWGQHIEGPFIKESKFDYGAKHMTRAYQSWTLTATLYSPLGGRRLVDKSRELGVHMNADAFVYHRAHCGDFEAYAPKPQYLHKVAQFNEGHSLIQSAEY